MTSIENGAFKDVFLWRLVVSRSRLDPLGRSTIALIIDDKQLVILALGPCKVYVSYS